MKILNLIKIVSSSLWAMMKERAGENKVLPAVLAFGH
jgi:hypothetical protein